MIDQELLSFAALAVLLTVTPGADTMLLFRNVVREGRRAGVATILGGRLGLGVHAVLSVVGLSAVVAHSAFAFRLLQTAGGCFLIWLGLRSVFGSFFGDEEPREERELPIPGSGRKPFVEGLLTNLLNPKTAVFYLALLPQFIRPGDPILVRSLLLCSVHILFSLGWYLALCLIFDGGRRVLSRRSVRRLLDFCSGVALVGFGARLLFVRR